jgi:hypothetical protein
MQSGDRPRASAAASVSNGGGRSGPRRSMHLERGGPHWTKVQVDDFPGEMYRVS